jgi:CRP/FNR family transcriptional regulator
MTASTPSPLQALLEKCRTTSYRQGSIILYQGEVPRAAMVIKEGIVKAYTITPQGDERIVTFNIQDEIFPLAWAFDKAQSTFYYFEALTDCVVYQVPREELQRFIAANPQVMAEVLDYYITSYSSSLLQITALEQAKASEKIMYTLYFLMGRYGREIMPGVFKVNIDLTHQMIASLVGLTRETTATEILKLKKRGAVTYKSQRYIITKEVLVRLMGEDSFADITLR